MPVERGFEGEEVMFIGDWHEVYEEVKENVEHDEHGNRYYTCPECGETYDSAYDATNCCKALWQEDRW